MSLVDLHSHTTESDGTDTPEQLIAAARAAGVTTLAITDHDTMSAHSRAAQPAADAGIRLIRGVELTCSRAERNIHLLAYFQDGDPGSAFDAWLESMIESRRDRNRRLAKRLQSLGLDVRVEEVEKHARRLAARPHFARVLVEKGYARTMREAFDRYIGESGAAYVQREAPAIQAAIEKVSAAGGISSLAHPVRLERDHGSTGERLVSDLAAAGLGAIEAFHSDHSIADTRRYLRMAERFGLAVTGGSDYHGDNKENAAPGRCAMGSQLIPRAVLDSLRERRYTSRILPLTWPDDTGSPGLKSTRT